MRYLGLEMFISKFHQEPTKCKESPLKHTKILVVIHHNIEDASMESENKGNLSVLQEFSLSCVLSAIVFSWLPNVYTVKYD